MNADIDAFFQHEGESETPAAAAQVEDAPADPGPIVEEESGTNEPDRISPMNEEAPEAEKTQNIAEEMTEMESEDGTQQNLDEETPADPQILHGQVISRTSLQSVIPSHLSNSKLI